MSAPVLSTEEYERLTDYERGWIDGVWLYSWWKDGVAQVGTTGRTYREAVEGFLENQRGDDWRLSLSKAENRHPGAQT
jgi:hypothetical protein